MDDLLDMIVSDESPSQISDRIKEILFAKSAERVEAVKPYAAAGLFGEEGSDDYEDANEDDYEEDEED